MNIDSIPDQELPERPLLLQALTEEKGTGYKGLARILETWLEYWFG